MTAIPRSSARVIVVALMVFLRANLAQAGDPLQDSFLRAGVVPDADLLLTEDAAGLQKAPIQAKAAALQAEFAAKAGPGRQARSMQVNLDKWVETLGIAKEDVVALLLSARVRSLVDAPQAGMTTQLALQQLGLVGALRLTKPASLPQIRLALGNAAAEGGLELTFETGQYKGAATLSAVRPDQPGKNSMLPRELTVALLDRDTAIYVGTAADVKAALDRVAAATPVPFTAAIKTALDSAVPGSLFSVFFDPGDALRAKAKESGARMQGQNPMLASAMQATAGLQNVVFGANASDRVSMRLTGTFAVAQEAVQMKTVIDGMVLAMGKMLLLQAVGRPIPFIESLNSRQEGNSVSLVADLTEEDFRALLELQAKGSPGAPEAPGAPTGVPAAPTGVPAAQAQPAAVVAPAQ
jgi:hypothetical protein